MLEYFYYDDDAIFFTLTKEERIRYDELNIKGLCFGINEEEKKELIDLYTRGMKPYGFIKDKK